jgi:hypothetical protein
MLANKHAAVIGIDAYGSGFAGLKSAVADARAIADALARDHGYSAPTADASSPHPATARRGCGLPTAPASPWCSAAIQAR